MHSCRSLFAAILLVLLMVGCTDTKPEKAPSLTKTPAGVVEITDSLPAQAAWTAESDGRGGYWLVWYGDRPSLQVRHPDGHVQTLIDMKDAEQAPSGLAVAAREENVWIAYRNKEPVRDVFLRREGANPLAPVGVSGDTMALARVKLHATDKGVRALWYGEVKSQEARYNLFLRAVDASGAVQGTEPERIVSGIYPVWVNDGAGNMGVFSWVKDDNSSRIVARAKRSGAVAFGETVVVRDTTPSMTIPFDAFVSGSRWFVYWVAQHGKKLNEYLVEGAWSDDQGASWTPFDVAGLRGWGIETISVAADGKNIVLAMAVAPPNHPRPDFREVRLIRSVDNGASWSEPFGVRDEKAVGYARALSPKVAFIAPGKLFLMWEDWREVRGRVRYSVSDDAGASWAVADARLPVRDGKSMLVNLFANAIIPTGDGGVVLILEEMTDQFLRKQLVSVRLDQQQMLQPQPGPVASLDGLEKRVTSYWAALQAKDYKAAYDLLDPFYRARVDYPEYLKAMGRVVFEGATIKGVRLEGFVAHVAQDITAGVPAFFSQGRKIEVPSQLRSVDINWIWLDGEWYLEYISEARGGIRFARY